MTSVCSTLHALIWRKVLDRMAPQIEAGLPFIFLEPSCASIFKDELLELFPDDAARAAPEPAGLAAGRLAAAKAPGFGAGRLQGRRFFSTATAITRPSSADRRTRLPCYARPAHGRADPGRLLRHGRTLRL